jgi:hypothetical protein
MLSILTALILTFPTAHPHAAPKVTSLTNSNVNYTVSDKHYVTMKQSNIEAIIVDNASVHIPEVTELPLHRAGYSGLASLKISGNRHNLFVPSVSGLNFEHIHDGTLKVNKERFEPRKFPMELRVINANTVELYQPPTKNWKLESCGRYQLLPDGTIEYTFECIPRENNFENGYMGFFWASYINKPQDRKIYFKGNKTGEKTGWVEAFSEKHGVKSTHPPAWAKKDWKIHPQFSLTLVNNLSDYVHQEPWYYGISHQQAYVQMFRKQDHIWFAQSPTGGGNSNPAWDFQWFVPDYQVGQAYGFVMRAALLPTSKREKIIQFTKTHLQQLNP